MEQEYKIPQSIQDDAHQYMESLEEREDGIYSETEVWEAYTAGACTEYEKGQKQVEESRDKHNYVYNQRDDLKKSLAEWRSVADKLYNSLLIYASNKPGAIQALGGYRNMIKQQTDGNNSNNNITESGNPGSNVHKEHEKGNEESIQGHTGGISDTEKIKAIENVLMYHTGIDAISHIYKIIKQTDDNTGG